MMQKQLPKEYYQLLEELQAIDFVLIDLTLYLDTHPHDVDAIAQYNQYSQLREQVKVHFESLFGPLQQGSPSNAPWGWSESPWPWQV